MQKEQTLLLDLLQATVLRSLSELEKMLPVDISVWSRVIDLASEHGVAGLVFSAVEGLPKALLPDMSILMKLFGQAEYQKAHYKSQFDTAQKFAHSLKSKSIEMKVLKGISLSIYYDDPTLRECGDCDIYLETPSTTPLMCKSVKAGASGFEHGNKAIEEIGGRGEFGSYKHSHLYLDDLMFENHHYITDFNGTKKGKKIELLLEKAIDSVPGSPILNSDMVQPCAYFNALHLIRHAQGNFILEGMTLRMIYDWAVFLRAEQSNLNWKQLYADFETCGLREFVDVMTSICVDYLGLKLTCKDVTLCNNKSLVEDVLNDTLSDTIHMEQDESLCHKTIRILSRYKRVWHYRRFSIESVPMMIWNSFAFSSYMKRKISLD